MTGRRELLGLAAASAARLKAKAEDDETIWRDYVEWCRRQPASLSDTRAAYLERLRGAGMPPAELLRRAALIERLSGERRDELLPIFFDRTYSDREPRFNTLPNVLLVDAVRELKPGRALDIHMGQGRNAVFLASRGWQVTGFDFSAGGVRAAREAAREAGVKLTALIRRHEEFDFGRQQWDLVVMSYTWVPLRAPYTGRILASLKPGGVLVFEHLMDQSGSERAAPWLPRPDELPRIFARLRILLYEDTWTQADWSWRPERIARLVAARSAERPTR